MPKIRLLGIADEIIKETRLFCGSASRYLVLGKKSLRRIERAGDNVQAFQGELRHHVTLSLRR